VMKVTNYLEELSVYERRADVFHAHNPKIAIVAGVVVLVDEIAKSVHLSGIDY
jgi:hypothetical protein